MTKNTILKHRTRCSLALLACAAAFTSSIAHAGTILFGIDDATDSIVQIDTMTGAVSTVGAINSPPGTFTQYIGLAADSDGTLVASAQNRFGPQADLVRIDAATGAEISRVGSTPGGGFHAPLSGLTFDADGELFASQNVSSSSSFGTSDPDTGLYSVIATTGQPIVGGTFFSGLAATEDGDLFGIGIVSGLTGTRLLSVDPDLGTVTDIGGPISASGTVQSITFDDDGVLYAVTSGTDDRLLTIDPLTGLVLSDIALGDGSSPGNPNPLSITGIAFAFSPDDPVDPVPLPAAAWLFLAGAGGFLAQRRRRPEQG